MAPVVAVAPATQLVKHIYHSEKIQLCKVWIPEKENSSDAMHTFAHTLKAPCFIVPLTSHSTNSGKRKTCDSKKNLGRKKYRESP